jgi:trk system potassium uptake protein TrkA
MGQQILVIGLGTFGSIVADELARLGHEVMGCDSDPRKVADLAPRITQAFELDATDADAIRAVGPGDFDVCVVALDPSATILATMILERSGAKTIVARAASELDGEILQRVGADRVVYTDLQVATWIAHTIDLASAIDFIRLSGDVAAVHLRVGPATIGRRVGDIAARAAGLRIVSLHKGDEVLIDPPPDTLVEEGDTVLVVGHEQSFRALAR